MMGRTHYTWWVTSENEGYFWSPTLGFCCAAVIHWPLSRLDVMHLLDQRGEGRTEGGREGVCVFGIQSYIHELTYPETLSPTSLRKLYFLINIFATFVQKSFRGCGS